MTWLIATNSLGELERFDDIDIEIQIEAAPHAYIHYYVHIIMYS